MSRKTRKEAIETATVDVRGVEPDAKTDCAIEIWMAKQKAVGNRLKKGEAVVELVKIGLQTEGEIL
jgi:hypothetical protein